MKKWFLTLSASLLTFIVIGQTPAEFIDAGPGIKYQSIGTYDLARLKNILNKEVPASTKDTVQYAAPKYPVKLYRVLYNSVVPEQNNRPTVASGLIAIPVNGAKKMPMVSYQHGTVFGKEDVPSFPENSFETRLMIGQFAAQGYVVIGADYFGCGSSTEKDSYIVLGSQVQASYDMYQAALVILAKEGISISDFFVTGWSQGGVITMAFRERLEAIKASLKAAGTASAQCDGYVMGNQFLNFPRKIDAYWVSCVFILTVFSFEEYYQVPGLAYGFFNPEQYEIAKAVYNKDQKVIREQFPSDLRKLIRPEYFDPEYFRQSAYGKLIGNMHPYRSVIETPTKMYYGDIDECVTIGLGQLPANFQKAMGNTKVEAISAGPDADHRKTFARAVPQWKKWFDSMLSK